MSLSFLRIMHESSLAVNVAIRSAELLSVPVVKRIPSVDGDVATSDVRGSLCCEPAFGWNLQSG